MEPQKSHPAARFCSWLGLEQLPYTHIDTLFVPPHQYKTIKTNLNKYSVTFLCGEPHLGKTYTALYILYECFKKGFSVDFKPSFYRKRIYWDTLIRQEDLLPQTVLYYKDIFGSIEPENVQIFASELKKLIKKIQNSSALVIVTSQLKVYNKIDPEEFPIVYLTNNSYTQKRKLLINRYGLVYNKKLDNYTHQLADKFKTPHSVKIFCETSFNTKNILKIAEKTKNIPDVFSEEISHCIKQEKIFLYVCYFFLESRGTLERAKKCYSTILKKLAAHTTFEELLKRFNHRIEPFLYKKETFRRKRELQIMFSSGFAKSIEESFVQNNNIISTILSIAARSTDYHIRKQIPEIIGHNFDRLPERCHVLLKELAHDKNHYVRAAVAVSIGEMFNILPEEYRLLLKALSEDSNPEVRWSSIESAVTYHFEHMTDIYRECIGILAKDENSTVRSHIARIIGANFEKIPEKYQNILLELAHDEDQDVRWDVAKVVDDQFQILPEEYRNLLFEFSKDTFSIVRSSVVSTIDHNFYEISEEHKNLLIDLAHDAHWVVRIAIPRIIGNHFEELPKNYQKILLELEHDEHFEVKEGIIKTVAKNFEKLPENYQTLLLRLAFDEDEFVRWQIPFPIVTNFDKLPEEYKMLLVKSLHDQDTLVRTTAAEAVCRNLKKLPEKYRKPILELAQDSNKTVRWDIAGTIARNFFNLTEQYRKILFRLAEDHEVKIFVTTAIAANFEILPEEYRKILFRLAEDEDALIRGDVISTIGSIFLKLPAEYKVLFHTLLNDTDPYVRARGAVTIAEHFEELPVKYHKMLRQFKTDKNALSIIKKWIGNKKVETVDRRVLHMLDRSTLHIFEKEIDLCFEDISLKKK